MLWIQFTYSFGILLAFRLPVKVYKTLAFERRCVNSKRHCAKVQYKNIAKRKMRQDIFEKDLIMSIWYYSTFFACLNHWNRTTCFCENEDNF